MTIELALCVIDKALTVAMDASRDGLRYWENNINDSPWNDEFTVAEPSSLTPEWRIALLARPEGPRGAGLRSCSACFVVVADALAVDGSHPPYGRM